MYFSSLSFLLTYNRSGGGSFCIQIRPARRDSQYAFVTSPNKYRNPVPNSIDPSLGPLLLDDPHSSSKRVQHCSL